jgi:Ca-activated chloride channel family protein
MTLARPWWLLLLLLIPTLAVLYRLLRWRLVGGVGLSAPPGLRLPPTLRATALRALPLLRILALALLVFSLAGPRLGRTKVTSYSEGIDIVLALDISGSMRALDFPPGDRLQAAKQVAWDFIEGRPTDRIGLVVFASNSYTQCPLTGDHAVLNALLDQVKIGDIDDGTAIGMAIGNALNRLKDAPGESRVIVLLTDGMNNTGALDPLTAAQLATSMGVRIYTVGAGTKGKAPFPVEHPIFGHRVEYVEVDLDEDTLQSIADATGGFYFRATDIESLERVYQRIDELETTEVETEEYVEYRDLGGHLLLPALGLVLLEILFSATWLRRLP